jgi:hypothetical protein
MRVDNFGLFAFAPATQVVSTPSVTHIGAVLAIQAGLIFTLTVLTGFTRLVVRLIMLLTAWEGNERT